MSDGKVCSDCGSYKKASAFSSDKRTKDGLHGYCKPCSRKHARGYRRHNPEKTSWKARKAAIEMAGYRRGLREVLEHFSGLSPFSMGYYSKPRGFTKEYVLEEIRELMEADGHE